MNRDEIIVEISDLADAMCNRHTSVAEIWGWDKNRNWRKTGQHVTEQDGLLKQLADAGHTLLSVAVEGMPGTPDKPKSKPPGSFEAYYRRIYIGAEAGRWCQQLGIPGRKTAEQCILGLVGKAPNLDDVMLGKLALEIRFWHRQAAAATGWENDPYTPPVKCPNPDCATFGSIRVHTQVVSPGAQPALSAYCVNAERDAEDNLKCGLSWGSDEIQTLVRYVQAATNPALAMAS